MGNTLVIVEHDEDTMYAADHIVDIGPGAGIYGGELVAQGTVDDIKVCKGIHNWTVPIRCAQDRSS